MPRVTVSQVCRVVGILGLVVGTCAPAAARGDILYVVSKSTNKLLRLDSSAPSSVTTLTGSLFSPSALAMGVDGNLYIAEWGDGDTIDPRISRYDLANNTLTVVTTLDYATQSNPSSLAFRPASQGGQMLVGRLGAGPVLMVSDWNGNAATVANFTTGLSLDGALGLAVAPNGTLYVSDTVYTYNPSLGYAVASGPVVSFDSTGVFSATVAADGSASNGLFGPTGLVLDGNALYSASVMNGKIFSTNLTSGTTTEFATTGYPFEVGPLAQLSDGSLLAGSVSGQSNRIYRFSSSGNFLGVIVDSNFGQVGGIVAVPVPEPSAVILAGCGVAAVAAWRRRTGSRSADA